MLFRSYRTQWEPVDTEISRAQVRTDGQGKANASFTPQNGGSYIAIATVTDSSGHSQSSSAYLWSQTWTSSAGAPPNANAA